VATSPKRRSMLARLALSAVVTLLVIGAVEIGVRLIAGSIPELPQHSWISGQFQVDHHVKWTLKPGATMGQGEHINADGMRDHPLADPKPDAQIRVLVLGDSSVFGAGVDLEQTFTQRLELALNPPGTPSADRRIQLLNGGIPGYSTYQVLERLRRSAHLGLDGVILYNISDSQEPEGWNDDLWFHYGAPVHLVLRHAAMYRWAHRRVRQRAKPRTSAGADPTTLRVHIRRYRENLATLRHEVGDMGAALFYVVPPMSSDIPGAAPMQNPYEPPGGPPRLPSYLPSDDATAQSLQQRLAWLEGQPALASSIQDYRSALALDGYRGGLPVVDGPAVFQAAWAEQPEAERPLLLDPVHPSPTGHQLLADALQPALERWLSTQQPTTGR